MLGRPKVPVCMGLWQLGHWPANDHPSDVVQATEFDHSPEELAEDECLIQRESHQPVLDCAFAPEGMQVEPPAQVQVDSKRLLPGEFRPCRG